MKKIVAVMAIVGLMLPNVLMAAGGNHPMAGCGLGYMLFGNNKPDRISQVFAATTNGTGTQTFGITSGTSGCTEDGAVKWAKEAEVFAEVNLESIRRDVARGNGEYATSFASLLGAGDTTKMVSFMHTHYTKLFPNSKTTSGEMLLNLSQLLS